jgi:hypothetical protein
MTNKMTADFSDKPKTQSYFEAIDEYVMSLGKVTREKKAQVSYSVNRKFLWLWAYEKTADDTLYLTVCLDKKLNNPNYHLPKAVRRPN